MFFKSTKDNENKESILILTETANEISNCGKDIQETAENIMITCQIMPGSKGEAHKDLLLSKAESMERLAALYNATSRKYMDAAEKIANGAPENKILSGVFAYTTFFNDQLEEEEEDAKRILDILNEDPQDIYS